MLKRIFPLILAFLFVGQVSITSAPGAAAFHKQKSTVVSQSENNLSGALFDLAFENESDEDGIDSFQPVYIADLYNTGVCFQQIQFKKESNGNLIFSRINSAVRSFTCVYII